MEEAGKNWSDSVNIVNIERRVALDERQRVAEMSPDEMRRLLLTSEVTGLPNRRAFDEAATAPAVSMSDLDGLKALNDSYGYEIGNAFLRAKADALREVGLESYHDKGDEFLCRGNNVSDLEAKLKCARAILRNCTVVVKGLNGETLRLTGGDFSYGVGNDLNEAELRLKQHKTQRNADGELERGKLGGIRLLHPEERREQ